MLQDSAACHALLDQLLTPLEGIRMRRRFIEHGWLLNYRAWHGWPTQNYLVPLPDGSVHYFIPLARRVIERNVARRTKLLTPEPEWFQTLPLDDISFPQAEAVQALMRFIVQKKLQSRRTISSLCRCLQMYNFAVLQTSVKIQGEEVWPHQRAVDPFTFYVFPDTASCREEASICFEDTIIPFSVYDTFVNHDSPDKSLYLPLNPDGLAKPTWPYHMVERMAYRGLSSPDAFVHGGGSVRPITDQAFKRTVRDMGKRLSAQQTAFVSLTKVSLRAGARWRYAVLCNNYEQPTVVRYDEWEYEPLYQWATTRPMPGELYTTSEMDDIRVLQTLSNTALSQIESNRSRLADPPVAMDVSQGGRLENYTFQNRSIWKVPGDPNQIFKDIPIGDTGQGGMRAFQVYMGLMNAVAGGAQIAEGEPGRNMPRSGMMANNMVNLALADTEHAANVEEDELLTPGLADIYQLLVTTIPPSQLFRIPGRGAEALRVLSYADIVGQYSFVWEGSLAYESTQEKADKILQLLTLIMNPQVFQVMQQQLGLQGMTFDIPQMIRMATTWGIGERGLGEFIVPMTPQQQQMFQQQLSVQMQQLQVGMQHQQAQAQAAQARVTDISSRARERQAKAQLETQRAGREQAKTAALVRSQGVQDQLAVAEEQRLREQMQQQAQNDRLEMLTKLAPMFEDEGQPQEA